MTKENRETIERLHPGEEPPRGAPSIGPGRVVKALGYSLHGLASAWRTEGAFRQEVLAAIVLIPLAWFSPVSTVERVLLIASVLLVMVVELLNSSIEAAVDRISTERHPLSRKAKDTASAAVLVAITCAVFVWGATLGPWLLARIAGVF
jgi:diacylglycerol kinase (ATP)